MARSRTRASAAAITAGCSASTGLASISRASPSMAGTAIWRVSPGIRSRSAMAWCSPIWARPRGSRCCRATISSKNRGRRSDRADAKAGAQTRRSDGAGRALQLAASERQHHGPVPRLGPALDLQRRAIRATNSSCQPEKVDFFRAEQGVCYSTIRQMEDGRDIRSRLLVHDAEPDVVPATRDIVDARSTRVGWIVPVDDTHFTTYSRAR